MLHHQSFTHNRSAVLFVLLAGVIVLMGAAYALGRATVSIPSGAAVNIAQPAPYISDNAERAQAAEAARWAGLAGAYASNLLPPTTGSMSQQAQAAYTARWMALAEAYAARANAAYAARLAGQAGLYAEPQAAVEAGIKSQSADTAVAAHYTGLAIQEYVRTGNRQALPQCLTAEVLAALPSIGDDGWRTEIAICGE